MWAGSLNRVVSDLGSDYWKLWGSSAVSNVADGVFLIALPLVAVRQTDSPLLIAGLAVAGRLPWLLFALVAGALVDRWDRRRTMVFVQLVRAALVAVLSATVMLGAESLALLYVAALVSGICETLVDTAGQSL